MNTNSEKTLTMSDLAQFSQEILLPAIEEMLEEKFEEKLRPIRQDINEMRVDINEIRLDINGIQLELVNMRQELDWIKVQLKRLVTMETEDFAVLAKEVNLLKARVKELEARVLSGEH